MTEQHVQIEARRPLKSRESRWAQRLAAWLARHDVPPNLISVASIVLAALAGASLLATRWTADWRVRAGLMIAAIAGIQGRLLCNLLDGMVAVEGGKGTRCGEMFNDLPDRISDSIILVCAGYAASRQYGAILGWAAAVLAIMTAYVRVLGRSIGSAVHFAGPMAKPHRMAMLTAACAAAAVVGAWNWHRRVISIALCIIIAGCAVTIARRLRLIVRDLGTK
jgi:phosphatidylglycerophosphate synthase